LFDTISLRKIKSHWHAAIQFNMIGNKPTSRSRQD